MKIAFIPLCLILISCSFEPKSGQRNMSNIASVNENFEQFIKQFSSNKQFQLDRIRFPLVLETIEADLENGGNKDKKNVTAIEKSEWNHYYYDNRDFPDEKVKIIIKGNDNNLSTVTIRGVDSGTLITHFFENSNLGWFLVKITDGSD
jgi:hypothetical protein